MLFTAYTAFFNCGNMGKEHSGSSVGTSGSFLEKLVEILSDESNSPYICWQPSGLSFLIKDVSEFEANVLTRYFKHSNHNSFVRQLNMYNFVKTCNDANYREFHNPHFQRGRRDLMVNIKRKASQPSATSSSGGAAEKKPDVQYMTQRQKAMVEQQERENERAEQTKRRRAAQATTHSSQQSYSSIPPPVGPGSGAGEAWIWTVTSLGVRQGTPGQARLSL